MCSPISPQNIFQFPVNLRTNAHLVQFILFEWSVSDHFAYTFPGKRRCSVPTETNKINVWRRRRRKRKNNIRRYSLTSGKNAQQVKCKFCIPFGIPKYDFKNNNFVIDGIYRQQSTTGYACSVIFHKRMLVNNNTLYISEFNGRNTWRVVIRLP